LPKYFFFLKKIIS